MQRRKTGGRNGPGAFDQSGKTTTKPWPGTRSRTESRFAQAMTKSVFGRFYWDDALEREKQRAMIKKKKKKK